MNEQTKLRGALSVFMECLGYHFLCNLMFCLFDIQEFIWNFTPAGGDITDIPGSGKLWNDCAIILYNYIKEILKIQG